MNVPEPARSALEREMAAAVAARRAGEVDVGWAHLERAHVLSQPWARQHVNVHAAMLSLAVRTHDLREGLGQVTRLVVAAPGSVTGRYPVGNSGRARVSMFAHMAVPAELEGVLEALR